MRWGMRAYEKTKQCVTLVRTFPHHSSTVSLYWLLKVSAQVGHAPTNTNHGRGSDGADVGGDVDDVGSVGDGDDDDDDG